jgi:deoxyhypusine synthase
MSELTLKKIEGMRQQPQMPGHQDAGGVPAEPPGAKELGPIGRFIESNYKHFNAATVCEAARAYCELIDKGGKMFLAMAGAASTAEIGISLAEMIRKGKVHAICCTGANLEEDLFNLVSHDFYVRLPSWQDLLPEDEEALLDNELARVTDTAIPERDAMNHVSEIVLEYWQKADEAGESYFPYEYLYQAIRDGRFDEEFEIDPKNSWLLAACKKNMPIWTPGWEDSTLGNMFAACCIKGEIKNVHCVKLGIEGMIELCDWYTENSKGAGIGYTQLAGGIPGDFAICVVPLLKVDLKMEDEVAFWKYFVQITESSPSMGGYSGAVPNEKLTWYKLEKETPRFSIEGDVSIVAPLLFAYVLGK